MPDANTASPAEITYGCSLCYHGFKAKPTQPPPPCPSCGYLETHPANPRGIMIVMALLFLPVLLLGFWLLAK